MHDHLYQQITFKLRTVSGIKLYIIKIGCCISELPQSSNPGHISLGWNQGGLNTDSLRFYCI